MKSVKQKKSKIGYPNVSEGFDGELSLNITNAGIGLFGKVKDKWYKFGIKAYHQNQVNFYTKII